MHVSCLIVDAFFNPKPFIPSFYIFTPFLHLGLKVCLPIGSKR